MDKVTLCESLKEKMNEHLVKGLINLAIILYRLDTRTGVSWNQNRAIFIVAFCCASFSSGSSWSTVSGALQLKTSLGLLGKWDEEPKYLSVLQNK